MTQEELDQFSALVDSKKLTPKLSTSTEIKSAAFEAFLQAFISNDWPAVKSLLSGEYLDLQYLPVQYSKSNSIYQRAPSNVMDYLIRLETFSDDSLAQFFSIAKSSPHAQKSLIQIFNNFPEQIYVQHLGEQMAVKSFNEIKTFYSEPIDDFFFKGVFNNEQIGKLDLYKKLTSIFPAYFDSILKEDDFLASLAVQKDLKGAQLLLRKNKKLDKSVYAQSLLKGITDSAVDTSPNRGSTVWDFCIFSHKLIPLQKIFYVVPNISDNLPLISLVVNTLSNSKQYAPKVLEHFKDTLTLYYRFSYFAMRNNTKLVKKTLESNLVYLLDKGYINKDLLLNSKFHDVRNPSLSSHQLTSLLKADLFKVIDPVIADKVKLEVAIDNNSNHSIKKSGLKI